MDSKSTMPYLQKKNQKETLHLHVFVLASNGMNREQELEKHESERGVTQWTRNGEKMHVMVLVAPGCMLQINKIFPPLINSMGSV